MSLPNYQEFMEPVLQLLADGEARQKNEVVEAVANLVGLSTEQKSEMLDSGKGLVYRSRINWSIAYLKQAKAVDSPKRAFYKITDRGLQLLESDSRPICTQLLMQFPEFVAFRERSSASKGQASALTQSDESLSPAEQLTEAYKTIRAEVQDQLIDQLKAVDPYQFERIVVDVLRAMGYGIDYEDATRITGGSGDGGIDGVIDQDILGLDSIYVQAKRWQNQVGRPEVQGFAGALQGMNASRGVMISTSDFSGPAKEYAESLASTRIVLIDGQRLASLMFDHNVGVSSTRELILKSVDTDYFSPDE
jgi:restriction system protein